MSKPLRSWMGMLKEFTTHMTTRSLSLCSLLIIRPKGCWQTMEVRRASYITLPSNNEAQTRSTLSSKFTLGRIWRNESTAHKYHYVTHGGRSISITDNQRSKLSCRGLFIVIQCHHQKTNFKQLEGNNIYLPLISQILYRVRDRANAMRLVSSKRVLFGHAGYGRASLDYKH